MFQVLAVFPELESLRDQVIVALNQEYLEQVHAINLAKGDEIAFIPPISGGEY